MGVGPSGKAGPGTGPRTAAASGTEDGHSESSIGKGAWPWHLSPGRGTVPSVPSRGSEGALPRPGSPLLGKAAKPTPLGHTQSHSQELCVPYPGDWAQGWPQSHLCCSVGHRPRAALAEVLQALPGHGKDLLWGEQVRAAEGRDGTHGPLWERGAWLSQAAPNTPQASQGSPLCSPCGRCHWDPPAPGPAAPAPPHSSGAHTCTGMGVTDTCSAFPSPESRPGQPGKGSGYPRSIPAPGSTRL